MTQTVLTASGLGTVLTHQCICIATYSFIFYFNRLKPEHIGLQTEVTLNWCHNHALDDLENLRWRKMSAETREKLESMFKSGVNSASKARHMLYEEILTKAESDGSFLSTADKSILPDYHTIRK